MRLAAKVVVPSLISGAAVIGYLALGSLPGGLTSPRLAGMLSASIQLLIAAGVTLIVLRKGISKRLRDIDAACVAALPDRSSGGTSMPGDEIDEVARSVGALRDLALAQAQTLDRAVQQRVLCNSAFWPSRRHMPARNATRWQCVVPMTGSGSGIWIVGWYCCHRVGGPCWARIPSARWTAVGGAA
jgi:hypothetical protein